MTATDAQVRVIMRERSQGKTQEQAAAKANLKSRKTVAKYETLGMVPSQMTQVRTYRTRRDAFADDWPQMEAMLQDVPELEAKALFEWLCEQEPGKYRANQLRTFQRRVADWRALNQPQIATLEQVRKPGEVIQLDGTWLTDLGVTIQGQPFKHMLIHCVLPYSNWEWGRVVQSESLLAVRLGMQSSLLKLGYVPCIAQTDNSSAATRRLGISEADAGQSGRTYTEEYLHLLDHYGLEPRATHLGNPNENGDVEAIHGGLKRALKQALLLRGSCDFESLEAYEAFLFDVMDKRNRQRQDRLAEEIAVMKPLAASPLATSAKYKLRVKSGSVIRVLRKTYSVPTSLIGREVTVYVREWTLDVHYAGRLVETLPRLVGQKTHRINYRHLIDSLLRKPGGFRNYRFREDLFPTLIFRRAWEQLNQWHAPRQADLIYLRILRLAARMLECEVALALELLVESDQPWGEQDVEALIQPEPVTVPEVNRGPVELSQYDQLLQEFAHGPA